MVLNVAVTVVIAFIVTIQVPVPAQIPPDQPAKAEPPCGAAVSVTIAPELKLALLVPVPVLMPTGFEVTSPLPLPVRDTVNRYVPTLTVCVSTLEMLSS